MPVGLLVVSDEWASVSVWHVRDGRGVADPFPGVLLTARIKAVSRAVILQFHCMMELKFGCAESARSNFATG